MTIRYLKKHAALEGVVTADDAEALAQWLNQHPAPAVHLARCEHVHGAVLQVLLALRPKVVTPPADAFLAGVLASP
jgi:anti-sigma factor RsiW